MKYVIGENGKRVFCEETRKKMSEAKLRYNELHPEVKHRLALYNTGRRQSPETIAKRIAKTRGKKRSREFCEYMRSISKRGPENRFWRGGVSTVSERLRKCAKFRDWRLAVFIRDNYTCQACGKRGGRLHPHHIEPFSRMLRNLLGRHGPGGLFENVLKSKKFWRISNGVTLCEPCHKKTDTYANNLYADKKLLLRAGEK